MSFPSSASRPPSWADTWSTQALDRGRLERDVARFMAVAPLENCPDVEDCITDPSEIGRVCTYGPICGTCVVYRVIETSRGLLLGTCRIRTDRGEFPCTAPICESYVPRAGARPAPVVQLAKAPRPRRE